MLTKRELSFSELKAICCDQIADECSDDVKVEEDDLLGQEKSFQALDFGLSIQEHGYNIYLAGHSVVNKARYIEKFIKRKAKEFDTPDDWCYVYNFNDPSMPKPIRLSPGKGKEFKNDMKLFITEFEKEIDKQFDSIEFQLQKSKIVNAFKEKNENLMKQIKIDAEEFQFDTQVTEKDIYFIPIINGEKLSEEMFDNLTDEQQDSIVRKSEILQQRATKVLKMIRENQKESDSKVIELQTSIALILLREHILSLMEKYKDASDVSTYLEEVEADIVDSIDSWISTDEGSDSLVSLLPSLYKGNNKDHKKRYEVNLLIDHGETEGAPIVYGISPSFYNLVGKVEHETDLGNIKSDFTKIKPGLLHKANGGFLILEMDELLNHGYSWYILKLILKTGKIHFKEIKDSTTTPTESLHPLPIPLDIKIVLIGESVYYQLLSEYDSNFRDLFKMKIYFQHEAKKTEENKEKLVAFIINFVKKKNITSIDKKALVAILKYATRLVMESDKITSDLEPIRELLVECCQWAHKLDIDIITEDLIEKVIKEREERSNYVEERLDELISNNQILIDVNGDKVGQINALAVIDLGDYTFAKPSRITATAYKGKAGIINIEKESNMSGNVHNKGVHVLSGYLGHKYAKQFPLSLTCQICFEQNYSYVDGDSASSAELYAIISSISEIPIKQSIAVTGSINQFGEIQPIGGATYKVEGFYNVCKKKGLTGNQGVIVPYQNVRDLVLKEEILEAVREKKFHIYAVENVDEALEILMGMPADKIHTVISKKLRSDNKKRGIL
ncbi:Lon protease family protein [Vallitalea okinawensis]|uniref:Lon protease family protein n=1 Tax=Vallitalea okinawensis TaxID=2078660 RepID=UPI000CFB3512|nr:ATP-binding protein [Vallitalea okinawensis]